MRLQKYIENNDVNNLLEIAIFMDNESINEGIGEWGKKIKTALGKVGLDVHKNKGLIQMLAKSGKVLAQFFWHALKAAVTGDQKEKDKVKELANTEITKEQVIEFLLKLDQLTLHAITGPIHMIDALTGWHIWTKVSKSTTDIISRAKKAISNLEGIATNITSSEIGSKIKEYIMRLKTLFGLVKV